jgi:hypothetical protein
MDDPLKEKVRAAGFSVGTVLALVRQGKVLVGDIESLEGQDLEDYLNTATREGPSLVFVPAPSTGSPLVCLDIVSLLFRETAE